MTVKVTKPSINVREELADLKKPTGIAGEAMLRAETPEEQFNLISAGRRRMNLNGAMSVFQRGSVTGVSTHAFGADRYNIHNDVAGTIALTEDADVPDKGGFQSSYKIACTGTETFNSSTSNLMVIHKLEGQDSQCTNFGNPSASPLTLSFWIKSNRAGDFSVNFENELPSGGGADRGYQTKQTLNQADTWEYKVITIEGDSVSGMGFTNNTVKGLCFEISLSKAGSVFSGTAPKAYWHNLANAERSTHNQHFFGDSTSNYWKITGVQLELGKVVTPFEHRSYGEELAACQRYYQRYGGTDNYFMLVGNASSTSLAYIPTTLQTRMRAAPTFSTTGTMSDYRYQSKSGDVTPNAISLDQAMEDCVAVAVTTASNALTAGHAVRLFNVTNAGYFAFDAEL